MKTLLVITIVLAFNASGITYIDEPVVWEGGITLVSDHVVIDGGSITVLPDSHINLNGYYIYLDGGRIIAEGTGWAEDEVIEFLDATESTYEAIKEISVSGAGETSSFSYCRFYNYPDQVEPDEHPLTYPLYIIDARDVISYCAFKGSNTAIVQTLPSGAGTSTIDHCGFNLCSTGIRNTIGSGITANVSDCGFNGGYGIDRIPPESFYQGLCNITDCDFVGYTEFYCCVDNGNKNSYGNVANTSISGCSFEQSLSFMGEGIGVSTSNFGAYTSDLVTIQDSEFWDFGTAIEAVGATPYHATGPDLRIENCDIYSCGNEEKPSLFLDGVKFEFEEGSYVDAFSSPVEIRDTNTTVTPSYISESDIRTDVEVNLGRSNESGGANVYIRDSYFNGDVNLRCVHKGVDMGLENDPGGNTFTGTGYDVYGYGKATYGLIPAIGNTWDTQDPEDSVLDYNDDPRLLLDVRTSEGRGSSGPLAGISYPAKEETVKGRTDEENAVNGFESDGGVLGNGQGQAETSIAPASIGAIKALFAE